MSCRACLRAVWLPRGAGSQKLLPTFSLLVSVSFPFTLSGLASFPFPLLKMAYKVHKVYKVYRVYEMFNVYKVFKLFQVYKMYKSVALPIPPKPTI